MVASFFTVSLIFATFLSCSSLTSLMFEGASDITDRQGRFVKVVVPSGECVGSNNMTIGTCTTPKICRKSNGTCIGKCAKGYGACCVIQATATLTQHTRVTVNGTRIVLKPTDMNGKYTYYFPKLPNVQQVKLDFLSQSKLSDPDENGDCTADSFQVSGSSTIDTNGLTVCGSLTGQHMYLDYGNGDRIQVAIIKMNTTSELNVKVTFICERRVPASCLQYYTTTMDTIKSFGFPRQLNHQYYSICFEDNNVGGRLRLQECSSSEYNFFITGNIYAVNATDDCRTDWVQVYGTNQVCGSSFNTTIVTTRPFMIRVNFDDKEFADFGPPTGTTGCPQCFDFNDGTCYWNPTAMEMDICNAKLSSEDIENTGFCLEYMYV